MLVSTADTLEASEAGPNGVNVGFDFSWERAKAPGGYTASFLNADSVSLNNCGGANFTHSSTGCNFVFKYKVAGITQPDVSHSANWITWVKPTTYTLGSPSTTGCNSGAATTTAGGKAPVTLFDCFNVHSFGQVFSPASTGRLADMQFRMTCLVPWGANSLNLYAVLYRLTDDASALSGTGPIAVAKLDLSTCPSALSWDGKTFSDADFGWVEMPFKNVRVTSNTFYGVYFAGNGVPGTPPIGAEAAIAASKSPTTTTTVAKTPKTTTTSTTVPATTTTVKKRTPKTTTTTAPATTTTVAKKKAENHDHDIDHNDDNRCGCRRHLHGSARDGEGRECTARGDAGRGRQDGSRFGHRQRVSACGAVPRFHATGNLQGLRGQPPDEGQPTGSHHARPQVGVGAR